MDSGRWTRSWKILQESPSESLIRESCTRCCFNHFQNHPEVHTELHPFRNLEVVQIHPPNGGKFGDNEILCLSVRNELFFCFIDASILNCQSKVFSGKWLPPMGSKSKQTHFSLSALRGHDCESCHDSNPIEQWEARDRKLPCLLEVGWPQSQTMEEDSGTFILNSKP